MNNRVFKGNVEFPSISFFIIKLLRELVDRKKRHRKIPFNFVDLYVEELVTEIKEWSH